jgi:hypothetical protein
MSQTREEPGPNNYRVDKVESKLHCEEAPENVEQRMLRQVLRHGECEKH